MTCDKIVPLSVCSLNICRFSRLLIPVADLMFTLSAESKGTLGKAGKALGKVVHTKCH